MRARGGSPARKVKAARPGPTSIRQALQLGALCPTEVTGLCLEGQAAVTGQARGKRSIFPERVISTLLFVRFIL
ncbi:hypothetical protein ACWE42_08525 [Sutcliffiella cohnii]